MRSPFDSSHDDLSATLTWATPVKVDVFGAHLEAYINTLPIVNTHKLCNRFGSGDKAAVNKLPPELVLEIAEHIIEDERHRTRVPWSQDYRCYQHVCELEDHVSQSDFERIWKEIERDDDLRGNLCDGETNRVSCVRAYIEEYGEGWGHEHDKRERNWTGRIHSGYRPTTNIFRSSRDLLLSNFGLDCWTSSCFPGDELGSYWADGGDGRSHMTSAWLTMPRKQSGKCGWDTGDGGGFSLSPTVLSNSVVARFNRALNLLDLEPYVNHGHPVLQTGERELAIAQNSAEWPKLTVLISGNIGM